jgi:hypothetical protein
MNAFSAMQQVINYLVPVPLCPTPHVMSCACPPLTRYSWTLSTAAVSARVVQSGVLSCVTPALRSSTEVGLVVRRHDGACTRIFSFHFGPSLEPSSSHEGPRMPSPWPAAGSSAALPQTAPPGHLNSFDSVAYNGASHHMASSEGTPHLPNSHAGGARQTPHNLKDITWKDFLLSDNMASLSISIESSDAAGEAEGDQTRPEQPQSQAAARTIQKAYRRYIEAMRGKKQAVAVIEDSYQQ